MKEYIERAAVHDLVKSLPEYHMFNYDRTESRRGISPDDVDFGVDKIPAADVVEVVRCKNCRFFSGRQECYCHAADENGTPIFVRENDFCSYGQRKEAGHEVSG